MICMRFEHERLFVITHLNERARTFSKPTEMFLCFMFLPMALVLLQLRVYKAIHSRNLSALFGEAGVQLNESVSLWSAVARESN